VERVVDRKRIHRQVAEIGDAMLLEWIDLEDWIPRSNDRGLHAHVARPESRARAIGRAAIERDADDGDVEFVGIGDVGQAAERRNAGEAGVFERVGWLGMREAELTGALGLRHEAEMLGARCGQVNCETQDEETHDRERRVRREREGKKKRRRKKKQIPHSVRDDSF
jgi:hypothetical protein